ncbi:MAG: type II toxin-antitoxin system RelE/ParE family toxin [Planctomyces sp.]|nr:type II toxin-antitoxin system RelE/ParE family toxin [Planctomyces sp.]
MVLTELALSDLAEIRDYSTKEWGKKTAEKYLDDLEAGLQRMQGQPALLSSVPDLASHLRFYRVRQHLLVCDFRPGSIVVLTVIHGSMDIPSRLGEMQPTLAAEVAILHKQLDASTGKKTRSRDRRNN